ncbi:MAG: GyrI-like domain-containing protein [Oscillospiraceae bacterium]|nr:GyrI-like domain-containing protein [Oscillospiraceae bacterium]
MSEPAKKPTFIEDEGRQPESYSPKKKPEIVSMAQEASHRKTAVQPAPATIRAKDRNAVRIIELPACKMVTSGPISGEDAFAPGGALMRFHEWFTAFDKTRADAFYPRDFMWSPSPQKNSAVGEQGGFEWGYAVTDAPEDTGGFDVIDFPGGLYAVAISVDADGKDHNKVYSGIQDWVKKSGCFALEETDKRRSLGNITSPPAVMDIMGYSQMDLYFPIRIKGVDEA